MDAVCPEVTESLQQLPALIHKVRHMDEWMDESMDVLIINGSIDLYID